MLDATPPEVVAAAAAAGFEFAGVRLMPTMPGEQQHPMLSDAPMMKRTLQLMQDTGVQVSDIEALWLKPDSDPSRYLRELEAAGRLGARWVQVISADPLESRVAQTLAAFCEAGRPFGLSMSFEFMRISPIQTLDAAVRIVEATGMSSALLTIDALHCFRCHASMQAIAALDPARIGLVQICDAPREPPVDHDGLVFEARFKRRLPGEGELPLREWLDALPSGGVMAIEAPQVGGHHAAPRASPIERARVLMGGLKRFFNPAAQPGAAA